MYPRYYTFTRGYAPDYSYWSGYHYSYPGYYLYGYSGNMGQQAAEAVEAIRVLGTLGTVGAGRAIGEGRDIVLRDYGAEPLVVDIEEATEVNRNYRMALWTGKHLQLVLMSLRPGEDIGLEVHEGHDQFFRIEEGEGRVQIGDAPDNLYVNQRVEEDDVIIIPSGTWHNLTNIGNKPLKLYTIYAPPEHPFGTVHESKQAAMAAEA